MHENGTPPPQLERTVVLTLTEEDWTYLDSCCSDNRTTMRRLLSSIVSEVARGDMREEKKLAS